MVSDHGPCDRPENRRAGASRCQDLPVGYCGSVDADLCGRQGNPRRKGRKPGDGHIHDLNHRGADQPAVRSGPDHLMLHVCCIRAGAVFAPAYVTHLKDMVARNLEAGLPGRFVCFTDRPEELSGVEAAPLPADLPKWWSKLALFKRGLFPDGDDVLFFDLDTLIVGPIDDLVKRSGEFAILRDFYRPHGLQSAVMSWRAGDATEIWETFKAAGCPMDDPGGDQAWIERIRPNAKRLQDEFPGLFVSYKQCRGIPEDASVVCFHGHPRPHEVTDGWVPRVWKEGGISRFELKAICN